MPPKSNARDATSLRAHPRMPTIPVAAHAANRSLVSSDAPSRERAASASASASAFAFASASFFSRAARNASAPRDVPPAPAALRAAFATTIIFKTFPVAFVFREHLRPRRSNPRSSPRILAPPLASSVNRPAATPRRPSNAPRARSTSSPTSPSRGNVTARRSTPYRSSIATLIRAPRRRREFSRLELDARLARLRVARRGLAPARRAALARLALTRVVRARLQARARARERALRRRDVGHRPRVGTH